MPVKQKLKVGFLINQFENTYNSILWRKVVEVSREKDVNVIFFAGKNLNSPYDYEKQYNVIYSLINERNVDGIIVGEYLKTFITLEEFENFLKERFLDIPLVTFGCKLKDIPTVTLDQKNGAIEAINHLVDFHNIKQIAFIKGPEGTRDAEERFSAYLEGLKKHNIPFDQNLVLQGNFNRDRGYLAAKELIINRKILPEAIIGANDETILGVIDFLKEKKIKVPKDIKLIGFDNIFEAQICIPSITTVRQPLKKQVEVAFDLIQKIINKEKILFETSIPCEFLIRESCGCFESHEKMEIKSPHLFSVELEKIFNEIKLQTYNNLKDKSRDEKVFKEVLEQMILNLEKDVKKYENNFIHCLREQILEKKVAPSFGREIICELKKNALQLLQDERIKNSLLEVFFNILLLFDKFNERLLLQDTLNVLLEKLKLENISQYLTTTFNLKNIVKTLSVFLKDLNIKHFLLVMYRGRVKWKRKFEWFIPKYSKVLLDYKNGEVSREQDYIIKTEDIMPEVFFEANEYFSAVILPIFFEEEHYGYMLLDPVPEDDILCESIRREISTSVKGTYLIEKEKIAKRELAKAIKALKDSNKKLEQLSVLDELTGLYNRRGFTTLANQLIELSKRKHRDFLLFFIDLDGLKTINDVFGHKEGDFVLISASKVLNKTFRCTDVIARIGGDEFVVLAVDCTVNELDRIGKRLNHNLEEFNKSINKHYKINFSYGVAPYKPDRLYTLEELMEEADNNLYREKKRKKTANES